MSAPPHRPSPPPLRSDVAYYAHGRDGTLKFGALNPAAEPSFSVKLFGIMGLLAVVALTLASPGATRMWSWPWNLALGFALFAPAAAIICRTLRPNSIVALPSRLWLFVAVATCATVVLSALSSPYRSMSLRWSSPFLSAIAVFLAVVDWLNCAPGQRAHREARLNGIFLVLATIIGCTSVALWTIAQFQAPAAAVALTRNSFPLGHSNYTGGLALLMLPTAVAAAVRHRGTIRYLGGITTLVAITMLVTSGSRGALVGLLVLIIAAFGWAPLPRQRRIALGASFACIIAIITIANPRTRTLLTGTASQSAVAASNLQRSAMLTAGWRMGLDRPGLGWGPGTTPLAYPNYRAGLSGGVENVLQLHSTPVHVWAEFGLAGTFCLVAWAGLVVRERSRHVIAATTLLGYGTFCLTDWQLDVPVLAATAAVFAALLAPTGNGSDSAGMGKLLGWGTTCLVAVVALGGRADRCPELNARALLIGRDTARWQEAAELLRASLVLNDGQEIAHFNLGWLLVVHEPTEAERHFTRAAHLVPDKGGVYFGLGLARLNQGRSIEASRALALECLNDPAFIMSPWWTEQAIAAERPKTMQCLARYLAQAQASLQLNDAISAECAKLKRLAADSDFDPMTPGPERIYRRERTGYPVLMRNLDIAAPIDLFDVRERFPIIPGLPPKGWLPAPFLLAVLNEPARPIQ